MASHTLVVGGTGMLADVTRWLIARGDAVSLIARGAAAFDGVHPLALDYRDDGALRAGLAAAARANGPISTALCWIHSDAPDALASVAGALPAGARLVTVHGSAAAAPDREPPAPQGDGLRHHRVILGWICEGGRSRWLTHGEIAAGVIAALRSEGAETIVGQVRPWSQRP